MSSLARLMTRTDPAVNAYHMPRNSGSAPESGKAKYVW
jgi:hypothetical protein